MSTIEETVRNALAEQGYQNYMQYADRVIQRLTERERAIAQDILESAEYFDLDVDDARERLEGTGITMPPQTGNGELDEDAPLAQVLDTLKKIAQKVDGLAAFARQNGYSG